MDLGVANTSQRQPVSGTRLAPIRLDLLLESLACGLLDHYRITRPPVPVLEMLQSPPAGLERDLDLCMALPYGDAAHIRLLNGQGVVFLNPALTPARQRCASAREMLHGLCSSRIGQHLGLSAWSRLPSQAASLFFARCLLMPSALLPPGWEAMPIEDLAGWFDVLPDVAATRVADFA